MLANAASAVNERSPLCLDEYQHAIEVLDALKARLNREAARPGTALITGSTRQDALPRTAQALTGRLHTMTIWPLSQGEIAGVIEDFVVTLRADPDGAAAAQPTSETTRVDYVARVAAGGFPLALRRPAGAARNRWFDDSRAASLGSARPRWQRSIPPRSLSFGHLLESFVVGELRKQLSWLDEPATVGHWRTHDGAEVDSVVEFDDGRVLAFEVKANERVSAADLKGLLTLRNALGDRLIAGVALSTGRRSYRHEDRIYVMPVDRLWRRTT